MEIKDMKQRKLNPCNRRRRDPRSIETLLLAKAERIACRLKMNRDDYE